MQTRPIVGYKNLTALQQNHLKTTLSATFIGVGSASFAFALLQSMSNPINLRGNDAAIAWAITFSTFFSTQKLIEHGAGGFGANNLNALIREMNGKQRLYLFNSSSENESSHYKTAGYGFGIAAGFTLMALSYTMDERAILLAACLVMVFGCHFAMRHHIRSDFDATSFPVEITPAPQPGQ